jgi:ribosomal protein L6P/L9E
MLISNTWPPMDGAAHPPMPSCSVQEALAKLEKDKATIREVLAGVSEEDFANKIVKVPWGWENKLELMSLDFREHFINHKMQLFTYLKLLGFPVNTETLYFG